MTDFLLLAEFTVIQPNPGTIFWTSLVFLLVWGLLGRFAFRPIQKALRKREEGIQEALDEAKAAREEMANLKAENEKILAQAQEERSKILKEAKEAKESIIKEAQEKARSESQKILNNAKQEIENQKLAAMTDLKNQVGTIAIEIAEKVLRRQLDNAGDQEKYVGKLVDDIKLN